MFFNESRLPGAYLVDIESKTDERGFFARTFCQEEFQAHGLCTGFVQCNISYNTACGTLRGMHYQLAPHEETKLIRCTAGAVYDVIIDLRPGSATYKQWVAAELTAQNRRALYVPGGFAHGFVTLEDDSELLYYMSEFYHPESSRGVRWDDQAFNIEWPVKIRVVSAQDCTYPDFVQ